MERNKTQNDFMQIYTPGEWNPASVSPRVPIYLTPYKWQRAEEKVVRNPQAVDRNYKLKQQVDLFSANKDKSNLPNINNGKKPQRRRSCTGGKTTKSSKTEESLTLPQAAVSRVYQKLHEDKNMQAPYMYEVRNLSKRGTACQSSLPTIIPAFNIQMRRSFKQVLSEAIQTHMISQYGPDDMYVEPQLLPIREQRCLTSEKPRRRASCRSVKSQLSVEEPPVRMEKHPDSADVYNKHLIERVVHQP